MVCHRVAARLPAGRDLPQQFGVAIRPPGGAGRPAAACFGACKPHPLTMLSALANTYSLPLPSGRFRFHFCAQPRHRLAQTTFYSRQLETKNHAL